MTYTVRCPNTLASRTGLSRAAAEAVRQAWQRPGYGAVTVTPSLPAALPVPAAIAPPVAGTAGR